MGGLSRKPCQRCSTTLTFNRAVAPAKVTDLLLLDNYDSFTYNLLDYFGQLGLTVRVERNDATRQRLEARPFRAIVLSPGPGTPARAGSLMPVLERWAGRVPVLGICLGHQAIGELLGATLTLGQRPMHGKLSEIRIGADGPFFSQLPRVFSVTRYHSLVLRDLLPGGMLEPLAYTTDETAELMAAHAPSLQLSGLQFHPEAVLTSHGLALLANWAQASNIVAAAPELVGG